MTILPAIVVVGAAVSLLEVGDVNGVVALERDDVCPVVVSAVCLLAVDSDTVVNAIGVAVLSAKHT